MMTSDRISQIIKQIITAKLKLLLITESLVSENHFQFLELSVHFLVTSSCLLLDEMEKITCNFLSFIASSTERNNVNEPSGTCWTVKWMNLNLSSVDLFIVHRQNDSPR